METHQSPYVHCRSSECPLYIVRMKRGKNSANPLNRCSFCASLMTTLRVKDALLKRRAASLDLSPNGLKRKHEAAHSTRGSKFLSPPSKRVRLENNTRQKKLKANPNEKYATRLVKYKVQLSAGQSAELSQVIRELDSTFGSEVDSLINAPENEAVKHQLQLAWEEDKKKALIKDQVKNSNGEKTNCWSLITIRIALAVYTRSPAAREALRKFSILTLPSSSLTARLRNLHKEGICDEFLSEQQDIYSALSEENVRKGKPPLLSEGVLIFDQIKVMGKISWNTNSDEMMGLAMDSKDYASLTDLYEDLETDEPKPAEYLLQFLWRDALWKHDVMGAFYSSSTGFQDAELLPLIRENIMNFEMYGFHVNALVCDGTSSNLSIIKATLNGKDCSQPFFDNAFRPGKKIYWIVCPSYQLETMVNALWRSRVETAGETVFGWDPIEHLYNEDTERANRGEIHRVPSLEPERILPDSWAKPNVQPAKIMQRQQVLSALDEMTRSSEARDPFQKASFDQTRRYLEALNKMFERGLLSHEHVSSSSHHVIELVDEGFSYFADWRKEHDKPLIEAEEKDARQNKSGKRKGLAMKGKSTLIRKEAKEQQTREDVKAFLAWQTWDSLQIMVNGFKGFIGQVTASCPGRYVIPYRINGSAV